LNHDIAVRIVRALSLAETIPFREWRAGSDDRETIRNTARTGDLDRNFEAMVQWVESLLEDK
jgi:hypothetical protein